MAVNIKTLSQTIPITLFKDKPEPVWADDAGRNSNSGKFSGTFVGYFTTLHIEVAPLTKAQMNYVKSIFEVPIIEDVTFPNSSNNGLPYTENFYGQAIESSTDYWDGKYKSFSLDLTAVNPRNDI